MSKRNRLLYPIIMIFLGLMSGLVFFGQFQSKAARLTNPAYSYNELELMKKQYESRQIDLKKEIAVKEERVDEIQNNLKDSSRISKGLLEQNEKAKYNSGLISRVGDGVYIHLSDGQRVKGSEVDRSIAHAADLRDIVNVLWYSGAEAISINNERIVYNTSIDCIVNTILINDLRTTPPFEIKALGSGQDLIAAMENSSDLADIRSRSNKQQISFEYYQQNNIEIPPYSGVFEINFSRIK